MGLVTLHLRKFSVRMSPFFSLRIFLMAYKARETGQIPPAELIQRAERTFMIAGTVTPRPSPLFEHCS